MGRMRQGSVQAGMASSAGLPFSRPPQLHSKETRMKFSTSDTKARSALLALALGALLATTSGCIAGDIEEDSAAGVEQETVAEAASALSSQYWNGHHYMFFAEPTDWVSAKSRCESKGYDLTHINDDAEQNWLTGILSPEGGSWWIGFHDRWTEGKFSWVAGYYDYTNWAAGQPDNSNNQDCVAMGAWNGSWNDFDCSSTKAFICERSY
jgi:hypothetical protein